jgi:hypothetical protein
MATIRPDRAVVEYGTPAPSGHRLQAFSQSVESKEIAAAVASKMNLSSISHGRSWWKDWVWESVSVADQTPMRLKKHNRKWR